MGTGDDIPVIYNRATHPEVLLERIRELEAALRKTPCPKPFNPGSSKTGAYFASWCVQTGTCNCIVGTVLTPIDGGSEHG
jgi:hypothetical protein